MASFLISTFSCNPSEPYKPLKNKIAASNDIIQINDKIPKTFCLFTLPKMLQGLDFLASNLDASTLPLTSQDPIKLEVKVYSVTCAGLVVEGGGGLLSYQIPLSKGFL